MNIVPVLMLAFITFALGFGELMIAAVLPAIALDVGVSIPLAGQLVTAYALTFAMLSPPLAVVLQRISAGRTLVASLAVVAAANVIAAGAHGFSVLIAARIVAAAGSAVASPLALAAIDRVAHDRIRGRAHGIVFSGFSLAAMLGVPLGAVIAAHAGWRPTFGCSAVLAGLAACGAATLPRAAAGTKRGWAALPATFKRPGVNRTLLVSTLFLTAQYTAYTYFRPIFAVETGANTVAIVWLFFVFGIGGIGGTLLGGIAVDRYGTRPTLLTAIGGCGVALAALPLLARSLGGATLVVAVWALCSWGFSPAANYRLDAAAGDARDIALALNLTAFNIGIAAGSALGGGAIALAGLAAPAPVAALLCAAAFLIASGRAALGTPAERRSEVSRPQPETRTPHSGG